jgi:hypothetical protein
VEAMSVSDVSVTCDSRVSAATCVVTASARVSFVHAGPAFPFPRVSSLFIHITIAQVVICYM